MTALNTCRECAVCFDVLVKIGLKGPPLMWCEHTAFGGKEAGRIISRFELASEDFTAPEWCPGMVRTTGNG